ncbi:MAG TPA: hypothetical protein VD905_19685 [Flavobacteriales bacterium]|nr:hypothetical protein [Flavobacteriales bacterium]
MKKGFDILRDKNGYFNIRETVTLVFVVVILVSWIGQQFFGLAVPEYIFYSFVSLVGSGCFGYSFERKQIKNKFKNLKEDDSD